MAVAFLQEFSEATQEQYDQVVKNLERRGIKSEGRLFHVAGPMEDEEVGWRIVDVWESQEAFDAFIQKAAPVLQEVEMWPPDELMNWPVHNMLSGPENHL
jgi:quinol monooxygenase YgiN